MRLKSFIHAADGLIHTFKAHSNIRFHTLAALLAVGLGFIVRLSRVEFLLVIFTILLVFTAEMVNTAIESVVDLITKEYRQDAKIAKDVAAGMVLLTSLGAVLVASIIFGPHILAFFGLGGKV